MSKSRSDRKHALMAELERAVECVLDCQEGHETLTLEELEALVRAA